MKRTYICSCSMGKDSLAMLLRLIELRYPLDIVIFYDTGMEFRAIYEIRSQVEQLCHEHGIRFVELRPDLPFTYYMLEKKVAKRDGSGYKTGYSWCGYGRCRWATRHKLQAIQRFKATLEGDCIDYVGIAADELDRLTESAENRNKRYPLIEWGWTERDCLRYCREQGWHWREPTPAVPCGWVDLYEILDRVSCWCCANKNLPELYNIYRFLPQYWKSLKDLQFQTRLPMKKDRTVWDLERLFSQPGAETKYKRK